MAKQPRSDVREIVQGFAPPAQLRQLLEIVAQSVRVAHKATPSKWGLRLNANSVMLKVGFVEVLQVGAGWLHVLLEKRLVPKRLLKDRRLTFSDSEYANAPGCGTCDMDIGTAIRAFSELRAAHEAALTIASRSRIHTSTAKDHSTTLIVYLSNALGRVLPSPSYAQIAFEQVFFLPEELLTDEDFEEGSAVQILANRYERDPAARKRCIQHYGTSCVACELSLADRYGPAAKGLIHVHHLTPLASIATKSFVDPVRDLRPVCPNCHAVIHSATPPRTIDEVRKMVRR